MERRSNHHESGKDWDWDWDALAVRLASIVGEAVVGLVSNARLIKWEWGRTAKNEKVQFSSNFGTCQCSGRSDADRPCRMSPSYRERVQVISTEQRTRQYAALQISAIQDHVGHTVNWRYLDSRITSSLARGQALS
ncbi:hypothetical protein F5888DRAFT_1887519 [Russula emetica]|nr:hypothetical protein F5888DRAFT_1887519 [Russula emetica]